jgi:hypothetical protein
LKTALGRVLLLGGGLLRFPNDIGEAHKGIEAELYGHSCP